MEGCRGLAGMDISNGVLLARNLKLYVVRLRRSGILSGVRSLHVFRATLWEPRQCD